MIDITRVIGVNPAEFANIATAERDFWWYRGMRRILFGLLDPFLTGRQIRHVLEAGCGTGGNAAALAQRYGWSTYPLDLDMEGLRYARSLGLARLIQGDVGALPFRPNTFDAVFSLDVLVHCSPGEESRALSEFSRVLRPGGLLILRVSAFEFLRSRHSEFVGERQRFTEKRLKPAVSKSGIRILRITYANTLLVPVALAKFRIWEPLMRRRPQSGVQPVSPWLNRLLAFPLAAEGRWLDAGFNIPMGQSLILIGEKQG